MLRAIAISTCVSMLLLAGCKKDEAKPADKKVEPTKNDKPTDKPADKPATDKPPATPPAAAGPAMSCDKVLSQATRDKYLKGELQKDQAGATPTAVSCSFLVEATASASAVNYLCQPAWPDDRMKQTVDASRGMLKNAKDVPGVGRMAVAGDMGMTMMTIWDDDTNCIITATGSFGDVAALGKALVADLTPASLK